MAGVLFLDISLSVGWCWGTKEHLSTGPEWGVWLLPRVPILAKRIIALENELADAIHRFQPEIVGIEAPIKGGVGSADTAELLICLSGAAAAISERWERRFEKRNPQHLRAQVCGRAKPSDEEKRRGLSVKEAIVEPWVASMGWKISNNDARDAAVGWAYWMGVRAPGRKAA